jgi:hypothetical protein
MGPLVNLSLSLLIFFISLFLIALSPSSVVAEPSCVVTIGGEPRRCAAAAGPAMAKPSRLGPCDIRVDMRKPT